MAIDAKPHHYGDGRFPLVWSLIVSKTPWTPCHSPRNRRSEENADSSSLGESSERLSVYDESARSVRYHALRENRSKNSILAMFPPGSFRV